MLVDRIRKIVRRRRWIQRPSIILALLLIVLAFLARVVGVECGWRAVEHDEVAFFLTSPLLRKYTECGYLRIPDIQQWSFPLYWQMKIFCCKQQTSVNLVTI